jgi:hypothetical protein
MSDESYLTSSRLEDEIKENFEDSITEIERREDKVAIKTRHLSFIGKWCGDIVRYINAEADTVFGVSVVENIDGRDRLSILIHIEPEDNATLFTNYAINEGVPAKAAMQISSKAYTGEDLDVERVAEDISKILEEKTKSEILDNIEDNDVKDNSEGDSDDTKDDSYEVPDEFSFPSKPY